MSSRLFKTILSLAAGLVLVASLGVADTVSTSIAHGVENSDSAEPAELAPSNPEIPPIEEPLMELGGPFQVPCSCELPSCAGGTISASTTGCGRQGCDCVAAYMALDENGEACFLPPVAAICNP